MKIFNRSANPTPDDIHEAGRRLQNGSDRHANKVVARAVAAGHDEQTVAMQILNAAADHEPKG